MRFHKQLLVFTILSLRTLGVPTSSLSDLFTDPNIPVIEHLDPSFFNVTTTESQNNPAYEKRTVSLPYVLYSITMDGRHRGNFQDFLLTGGQMLIMQGIPSSGTPNGPNPFDLLISVGSPAVNPVAGSIRYATNRYLYKFINGNGAISLLDYAFSTSSGNSSGVTIDTLQCKIGSNCEYFPHYERRVLGYVKWDNVIWVDQRWWQWIHLPRSRAV
jgi:hypothetical protein